MKSFHFTPNRHGPAGFDNRKGRFIVLRMHPMKLKALRVFAAAAGLIFAAGCETTSSETVPTQVSMESARVYAAQPVYVAQVPASAPVSVQPAAPNPAPTPAQVATVATIAQAPAPAPATAAPAANAAIEPTGENNLAGELVDDDTDIADTTTNAAPVITQAIPPAAPANLKISEPVEKVIKLAQSGMDETVMMAYVEKSTTRFDLDADDILYLSDVGVPSGVISAMLKHDGDDPAKALMAVTNTEAAQPAIPAQTALPPGVAPTQPYTGQQPLEVTTNYVPNAAAPPQQQVVVQGQPQQVIVQQPATQVVVAQPESVQYFYSSLSPYGSWYYVTDYGWCWQPTVAVADPLWRPYGPRGHWLWTDAGWYWSSDYSWGWAPFHYGRWHHGGPRGWLWIPDRTWGPAWVTWRSSGDYCGWAPLPPAAYYRPGLGFYYHGRSVGLGFSFGLGYDAFCFTPRNHFHDRYVYRHFVPRHETHAVWGRSRADNHYEFRRDGGRDQHFVNRGFSGSVRQNERPASIRDNPGRGGDGRGNREHVERRGGETVVYRPTPPPRTGSTGIANGGGRGGDNNGRGPGRGNGNEGRGNGDNNGQGGSRGPRDGGTGGRPGGSGNGGGGGGRANLDPASPPASAETGVTRPGTGVQPRPGQVPTTTTRTLEPSQGRGQYTVRNTPSTPAPAPTPAPTQPSNGGSRPDNNDRGDRGGRDAGRGNGSGAGYQPNAPTGQPRAPRNQPNVNTRPQNPQVVTSPSAVTGTAATAGEPRIVDRTTRSVSPTPQPQVQTQPQRQVVSQPSTPAPRVTTSTSPYTPAPSTPTRGNVEASMRAPVGNPQPQYSRQAVSAPQVQQPQPQPQMRGAMPQRSAPAPQVSQPSGGRGNQSGGGNSGGNQGGGDNRGRGRGRE